MAPRYPGGGLVVTPDGETRSPQWEAQWFVTLIERVEHEGLECDSLIDDVKEGLSIGAREYGDDAFFADDRDNYREALAEARDLVCYAMGECQRLFADERDGLDSGIGDEIRGELLEAAVFAALAHARVRRARRRYREAWAPR